MEMIEARYKIGVQRFVKSGERVLVAVSGGVDSITLLHLTVQTIGAERVAVAHCNFSLRPGEADSETQLVEKTAQKLGVMCHVERYDTPAICDQTGESTQIAARRLRYDFFDRLCEEQGYNYVLTGHNTDDTIETFFINLMRGTGLRGLCGIPAENGRILRPMLNTTRLEIEAYAALKGLEFLNDSSNASDKYLRNKLRHGVVPLLREISQSFDETMLRNLEGLRAHQDFELTAIAEVWVRVVGAAGISIEKFRAEQTASPFLLYKLLELYDFNFATANQIFRQLGDLQTGRKFFSATHTLYVDRGFLTVASCEEGDGGVVEISREEVEFLAHTPETTYRSGEREAYFDASRLVFPLEVRAWSVGDRMQPFGLAGTQKVSDILTNAKVPSVERNAVRVVVSGGEIVWLVGYRTSENHKVSEQTRQVARVVL